MNLINTFLYFAVFKHPLTKEEALNFCSYQTDSVDNNLQELVDKKALFQIDDFYLPSKNNGWVERRAKGNALAKKSMVKAKKMARILSNFPFVRSVMVSGSLAKGYMDKKSDIDFFVIMKPGNIAIVKVITGLYRRFFAPKSFCVNYMITTDNLLIQKQNLFTAIEVATLIPLQDSGVFDQFYQTNKQWVKKLLPNAQINKDHISEMKKNSAKLIFESVLSSKVAGLFNSQLIKIYSKRLGITKKTVPKAVKTGELIVNKDILKFHGKPHQEKIMHLYAAYVDDFQAGKKMIFNNHFYD